MKLRFNRFALFPVMCTRCHRYIWLEKYRRAEVWHGLIGRYCKENICDDCIDKYK